MNGLGGGGCDPTEFIKRITKSAKDFTKFTESKEGRGEIRDPSGVLEDVFYQVFRRDYTYMDTLNPPKHKVKEFENHYLL